MNGVVMMKALGVCATVDEFEEFIRTMEIPRGARANFAVIDGVGGAAYFEVGDERYFRFDVKDSPKGYLYRTNFSVAGVEDQGAGYIRYEAATKLFEEKGSEFTPGWILDNPARSFYHGLMKQKYNQESIEISNINHRRYNDLVVDPLRKKITALEAENQSLKELLYSQQHSITKET